MDNKIQNGFVPQGQFNQQAPAFNAFGGFQNFQTQFNNFVNKWSTTMNLDAMAVYAENQIRALPETTMIVNGVAEQLTNVSRATIVPVWKGCCQTLTVRNTSEVPILVQNANIVFGRPDLAMTY